MKKRIISLLLLSAMLLSLAACGGDKPNDGTDTTSVDTTAPVETAPAGIEKKDYGGDVNILKFEAGLYTKYFDPGDDMTDIMNKALYNREIKVEDHLGVNITYENAAGGYVLYDVLYTAIASNDDLYQMVLTHGRVVVPKLITEGCLVDMNNLGIDFSAEWFN